MCLFAYKFIHRMKFLVLISLLSLVIINTYCQELLTIGETFDFEIEDKFQYESFLPEQPPNADRITITGKYYSVNGDTVFYVQYHNSYFSTVIWYPEPHLEYYFWTRTDTVFYTKLDSCISSYSGGAQYDTSMFLYDTLNSDSLPAINE